VLPSIQTAWRVGTTPTASKFYNPNLITNKQPKDSDSTATTVTIIHFNDNHKALSLMPHLVTAINQLSEAEQAMGHTVLRFNGGDNTLGRDEAAKALNIRLINRANVDVNVPGNHNFDAGLNSFSQGCLLSNAPWVVANLQTPEGSSLEMAKRAKRFTAAAYIIERDGQTFGVIGVTLPKFNQKNVSTTANFEQAAVLPLAQTAEVVQQQVNRLEAEGVNKIILVSHMGYDNNKALIDPKQPYQVTGVDIIVGGHTHRQLSGVVPNITVFEDAKQQPVLILESGQNAEKVGMATVQFSPQGRLAVEQVQLLDSAAFTPDPDAQKEVLNYYKTHGFVQPTAVLAVLAKPCFPTEQAGGTQPENPIANLIADTLRTQTGADLVLIPSSQLKDGLPAGALTPMLLREIAPFSEPVVLTKRTGAEILATYQAMATQFPKTGTVLHSANNVHLTLNATTGTVERLMLKNPNTGMFDVPLNLQQTYTVAVPEFFVHFASIKPFFEAPAVPVSPTITLGDMLELGVRRKQQQLQTMGTPFCFEPDGRLQVVAPPTTPERQLSMEDTPSNGERMLTFEHLVLDEIKKNDTPNDFLYATSNTVNRPSLAWQHQRSPKPHRSVFTELATKQQPTEPAQQSKPRKCSTNLLGYA
jgi:2',3'-cyclic-nucleotide 2'-phosphodiesterase (5'-nucleotidase family)